MVFAFQRDKPGRQREVVMNNDVLKRDAIYKAAGLARGDGLSVLYGMCETQKTISTKKVMEHIERTHEFMKDCANHMSKLARELPPNVPGKGLAATNATEGDKS